MKKKNLTICLFSLMSLGLMLSCNKYLDKKPDNTLVIPKSLVDFQALLDNVSKMNFITPTASESSSDDYFVTSNTYNGYQDRHKDVYNWKLPQQVIYPNDWSYSYTAVYYANLCNEGVDEIVADASNRELWENVKGSALFFRGFTFLNLVWQYAKAYDLSSATTDMGIVLRLGSDFNVSSERSSVKACYDQIIKDLKEAATVLTDIPSHVYRPSKAAAYAVLSRAYLSMRDYDSAFKYADLSLAIKNTVMDFNSASNINTGSTNPIRALLGNNPEIIFYCEMNGSGFNHLPNRGALVDTVLYASYHDKDIRKRAFLHPVGLYQRFKGSYSTSPNVLFSGPTTAEMYLVRAECLARGINGQAPDKDMALANLDEILVKRIETGNFIPTTAGNANEALDKILIERRKELMFRGLRWIDIKRLNKEGKNIINTRVIPTNGPITLQPNANFYAYPIPKDIIALTGIPQNPS